MRNRLFFFFVFVMIFSPAFLFSLSSRTSAGKNNLSSGYEAYRQEDWVSAVLYLKKAVAQAEYATEDNFFMLVKSEIFAGEYKQAQVDCELFIECFPFSQYIPFIKYQNGRLLHLIGKNEESVLFLSDFCHDYEGSDLYPSALFWIAESFYDEYNFDIARGVYSRIVSEFPSSDYASSADYKIALIDRRNREEKLLYLLKVTGEENLSTREEYERQLKIYETEDKVGLKKQLVDAQNRIFELEAAISAEDEKKEAVANKNRLDIEKLKVKAKHLQYILDAQAVDSDVRK